MRVRIHATHGVIDGGLDALRAVKGTLHGDYIVHFLSLNEPHSVEDWRKLYFHLRDALHDSVETGYTKKELHDAVKNKILLEMQEHEPKLEWFTDDLPHAASTTFLTASGWKEYIKRFKEFAMDMYEVYI